MDETYIKVKVRWTYLYHAMDRDGQTLDSMLSKRGNLAAARRFLKPAISTNGVPDGVVIAKSGANLACLQAVNVSSKVTPAAAVSSRSGRLNTSIISWTRITASSSVSPR